MPRSLPATVVLLLALTVTLGMAAFPFDAEEVVFYPTYGFSQGTDWVIRTPITSAEHLYRFVQSDGTVQHKQFEIARIMRRFPGRRFVLIGDSGEHDPEVYRRVKEEFGAQVQEIIIRDVTNARTLKPARLSGMTIVEAPTPVAGMSQSHSQIRTVLERRP